MCALPCHEAAGLAIFVTHLASDLRAFQMAESGFYACLLASFASFDLCMGEVPVAPLS